MTNRLRSKIPLHFVVIELDAVGTAEAGEDLKDVVLLFGAELVFTMMKTIVGAHAFAKVGTHTQTGLHSLMKRHVVVQMRKAPSRPYLFFLTIAAAVAFLPGGRVHSLTREPFLLAR